MDDGDGERKRAETMENCPYFNLPAVKPPEDEELVVEEEDQDLVRAVDSVVPMMVMTETWDLYHSIANLVATTTAMPPRTSLGSFGTRSRVECAAH